jgi:cytidine deaminase
MLSSLLHPIGRSETNWLPQTNEVFSGASSVRCNVENSSDSLTICAEMAAIVSAVAQEGGDNIRIRAVAVVNEKSTCCPPCDACRQVMFEFGTDALILLLQEGESLKQVSVSELLPGSFQLK